MRSTALASVFGAAAVVTLTAQVIMHLRDGASWIPVVLVPFMLLISLQQLLVARLVERRMASELSVPEHFWLATTFLEITLLSGLIAAVAVTQRPSAYALFALASPAVLAYFVFIVFSTLHLEPRVSIFTGAVAAIEYVGMALVILTWRPPPAELPSLLVSPYPFLTKAMLLMGGGAGAAFVARQLRNSIERSVAAHRERDRLAAADRAKSTFLAHMSHEIRAPLNAVLGYAEILKRDSSLSSDQRHAVATIGNSGAHLLAVVNQVLDLSRIEAGSQDLSVRTFAVSKLVSDLAAMFELRCRQKDLSWHVHQTDAHTSASVSVRGDADRLRQVLINLLDNAVHATSRGGVRLEIERTGDRVRFDVVDTGIGIPTELADSIFEPFRQLPADGTHGTGLGLAIARAQTELMGGMLQLVTTGRDGSRFRLELPLPLAAPDDYGVADEGERRLAAGCHVSALVVDDRPADRDVLATMLEHLGIEVRRADGAHTALAALRHAPVDVLFCDVRMNDMDGPALLQRIEEEGLRRGCRAVAMSASALAHEQRAILEAGFDAFLPKPIRARDLQPSIAPLIGVRFESVPADARRTLTSDGRVATVVPVPRALWLSLRAAAEAYSITDLKVGLNELAELGDEMDPLAEELRALSRTFDMERVVELLDGVPHV